jgi:hypothetical protein
MDGPRERAPIDRDGRIIQFLPIVAITVAFEEVVMSQANALAGVKNVVLVH